MPPPAFSRPLTRRRPAASPAAVVLAALGLALAPLPATAQPPSLEYAVKATFLYKFGPFVAWPTATFASPRSPFAVCVFGEDPFGAA
ncbi:MAG: YfiR family protein, partial [Caulobacteraceae bacterium]